MARLRYFVTLARSASERPPQTRISATFPSRSSVPSVRSAPTITAPPDTSYSLFGPALLDLYKTAVEEAGTTDSSKLVETLGIVLGL
ncbi:MAG: hypothetical protein J0I07_16950, partial [Myxococcales bacterium]|nr:hypothetical protein [Myxococcales bacterium]